MKHISLGVIIWVVLVSFSGHALAEDKAMPEDIIKKVREAAVFLSQEGEAGLTQFNEKSGRWVFKDTYVFVFDCEKGTIVAHPFKPRLIGRSLRGLKDVRGNYFFAQLCSAAQKTGGGWVEYWWPKVGEKASSRKISLLLQVSGTPYQVGAGIYDDDKQIEELEKLLSSQMPPDQNDSHKLPEK